MFRCCSFDATKYQLNYYRGEDCMKNFYKDLKEHATKIINYEKKEMVPLTYKENKSYHKQKACYICNKKISIDYDDKNIIKFIKSEIIVVLLVNIEMLLIIFVL